jgi:hypothetical protein
VARTPEQQKYFEEKQALWNRAKKGWLVADFDQPRALLPEQVKLGEQILAARKKP